MIIISKLKPKKELATPIFYFIILSQAAFILFLLILSYFSKQSFIITSYFNFPAARAASSWIQTDWTGGSGQDSWSDATKYSAVSGEGVYNSTELRMKINADVVIGQPDFVSNGANQGGAPRANTIRNAITTCIVGAKLFVADYYNNRVLIYNTIPTSNNASADVVIGQPDFISNSTNQGGAPAANTLKGPDGIFSDGIKLFIADYYNNRVLIYNTIPTSNNASADVVIGQPDFISDSANQGGAPAANTIKRVAEVYVINNKLFIADINNNRVLIYNTIPTSNNASADVVIGQPDFVSNSANQGGAPAANTLKGPGGIFSDGTKLFIADYYNNRVLIYNTIPTSNNASADVVIGQPDFISDSANQGGSPGANTIYVPYGLYSDGMRLFVAEFLNNRVLVYNSIPTSNNASADVVIGQPDFVSNSANQGGASSVANTLYWPTGVRSDGTHAFIADDINHRLLIYNLTPVSTTLTSSLFDAGSEQEWGPVTWTANTPANTSVTVEISTDNGTTWTAAANGSGGIKSQTMKYRVTLANTDGISTPTFSDISINYSPSANPALFDLSAPEDNISILDNNRPTLSWNASSDSGSGLAKYQLYIDGILDTDNIANTTNSIKPANSLSFNSHTWYVKAFDYAGNSTVSDTFTFNLVINPGVGAGSGASSDTAPPAISNISSSFITANTAIISWDTDESSNSQIEYGLSSSYGFKSSLFPNSIKYHVINLTNLSSTIVYHYRVISIDSSGNKAVSSDYIFTTLAGGDPALINISTPIPLPSETLTKDGTLLKIPDSPKVYVIIQGKKKWISTPEVFETLGYKWTNITATDQSALSAITDYEDNLIRANGDHKVWLVTNGIRHHVPNSEIFLDYGFSWTDVKDVPLETVNKYQLARLVRESKQSDIYYLSDTGIKKWIPTADVFNSYDNKWEDIQVISKKEMDSYPVSNLMSYEGKVYLIQGDIKRLIPNETILKRYNTSLMLGANQAEWGWYKMGSVVK